MIRFSVESSSLIGRGGEILDADTVLDEPFVYSFCGMCHENAAAEISLCENIGKGRGVIEMETSD